LRGAVGQRYSEKGRRSGSKKVCNFNNTDKDKQKGI
jgi:hypothetical protein